MTLREQAVDAMARAAMEAQLGCGMWARANEVERNYWLHSQTRALDAFLALLDATGWQIVPKVATAPMLKATSEAFAEVNQALAFAAAHGFHLTPPEDGKYAVERAYEAMLAAAPQPMGGEG